MGFGYSAALRYVMVHKFVLIDIRSDRQCLVSSNPIAALRLIPEDQITVSSIAANGQERKVNCEIFYSNSLSQAAVLAMGQK